MFAQLELSTSKNYLTTPSDRTDVYFFCVFWVGKGMVFGMSLIVHSRCWGNVLNRNIVRSWRPILPVLGNVYSMNCTECMYAFYIHSFSGFTFWSNVFCSVSGRSIRMSMSRPQMLHMCIERCERCSLGKCWRRLLMLCWCCTRQIAFNMEEMVPDKQLNCALNSLWFGTHTKS